MSDCQFLPGKESPRGYRSVRINGRTRRANRVVWERTFGPIPPGLVVMHTCDVRACVNPEHLRLGTQADNLHDMWAKGRGVNRRPDRGEENVNAKLTSDAVRAIRRRRAAGEGLREVARDFGVTRENVWMVATGKTWQHIQEEES